VMGLALGYRPIDPIQIARDHRHGMSRSALVEFMAPVQLKPYELQYFYAPRLRH
jgi:hypothetical protein